MAEKNTARKLQHIRSSAYNLFLEKGFRKISIEEICAAAHVSKMTFYKYFRDKDDLVVSIITEGIEKNFAKFREIVNSPATFREKIEELINYKLELASKYSRALLEDIYSSNHELQNLLNRSQEKTHRLFRDFYAMGVKEGSASDEIGPDFFIAASEFIVQMGNTPALKNMYPDPHERTRHLTNFFFYGILGGDRNQDREKKDEKKKSKQKSATRNRN